ncbi:hypothetical protein ACOMHN_032716 [Nucella lapillus]
MAAIMRGNRGGNVLVYRHFRYHKHRNSGSIWYISLWKIRRGPAIGPIMPRSYDSADRVVETDLTSRLSKVPDHPCNVHGQPPCRPFPELSRTSRWNQDRFLLHSDNDWGILIFATDENLSLVQRCRNLYMDGTFKSCPRPYTQVFTIFGRFNGFVVPFVHVLMERKTVGHYRQVFQAMKAAVRRVTHHRLRPALVSLWRRLQHLGLVGPYHENDRLAGVVRKIMALGYLPVALVQLKFNALLNRRRTRRLVAIHPDLDDFLNYVRNTYIRAECPFPPVVWNWRLLEERLVALKRQYNHGDRDLNEYWRAVSHLVLQAV